MFYRYSFPGLVLSRDRKDEISCINKVHIDTFLYCFNLHFIRRADDYIYVPLLQSLGNILGGIISMYLLLHVEKMSFCRVRKNTLFVHLRKVPLSLYPEFLLYSITVLLKL